MLRRWVFFLSIGLAVFTALACLHSLVEGGLWVAVAVASGKDVLVIGASIYFLLRRGPQRLQVTATLFLSAMFDCALYLIAFR